MAQLALCASEAMGDDPTREEPAEHALDHRPQGPVGTGEPLGPHAQ